MARLSATSNPTGLIELERQRLGVRMATRDSVRYFSLVKLDLRDIAVDRTCVVIFIARSGNTSQRFELGTVESWNKVDQALTELDPAEVPRYRVLIRKPDDPKIVASAENLRLVDESQADSLIPMIPADLGQRLWKLKLSETDGAELLFNQNVFPSASGAENYIAFVALVLPEALRQVLLYVATQPDALTDDKSPFYGWGEWLDALGSMRPQSAQGNEDDDDVDHPAWADAVVAKFCERQAMATTPVSATRT